MKKLTKFSLILAIVSLLVSGLYAGAVTKVWEKIYGGDIWDGAEAIIPTKDGGFIVAGYTYSFSTDKFGISKPDVYLIKIKEESHLSSSKE